MKNLRHARGPRTAVAHDVGHWAAGWANHFPRPSARRCYHCCVAAGYVQFGLAIRLINHGAVRRFLVIRPGRIGHVPSGATNEPMTTGR